MFSYELEKDKVYLKRNDKVGGKSRPVVDSKGNFFFSLRSAAQSLKVDQGTIRRSIEDNKAFNGTLFAWATASEAKRFCEESKSKKPDTLPLFLNAEKREALAKANAEKRPLRPVSINGSELPSAPVDAAPVASNNSSEVLRRLREAAQARKAFVGVEWPDGHVTVRLLHGGEWSMTRSSASDIPSEIRAYCEWKTM